MNVKFLYGKKSNLNPFITQGCPLWFRDLYSLGKIENQLICDDESVRKFCVKPEHIDKISLNGRDFSIAKNSTPTMNLPTRRCHVLCLSSDGNRTRLFQRFNADICVGINVDKMIDLIEYANRHRNTSVIGRDVEYYKYGNPPSSYDPSELVFKKNYENYAIENEFRIAVFWPKDNESSVMTKNNGRIKVFGEKASSGDNISLRFPKTDLEDLIVSVIEF